MLNKNMNRVVLKQVLDIVTNGKEIKIRADAPLQELCESTQLWTDDNTGLTANNAITGALEDAQRNRMNPIHVDIQKEVVDELADRIAASIGYTRDVVVPAIVSCEEYVQSMRDAYVPPDVAIEEVYIPEVVYSDLPFELDIDIPEVHVSSVRLGVSKESSTLNDEWADRVDTHWNNIFNVKVNDDIISTETSRMTPHTRLDYGLVMAVGADEIANNPSKVDSMGLDDLRKHTHRLKTRGRKIINSALRSINLSLRMGKLVIANEVGKIQVHGTTYQEYLDDGGTADALMGRSIADDRTYSKKEVLHKVIEYTAVNINHNQTMEAEYKKDTVGYTRDALKTWVRTHVEEMVTPEPVNKVYGLKSALLAIDMLSTAEVNDSYECVKQIVAKHLYYFTSSNEYLTYMSKAIKDNPKLNADEASLVATLETLSAYAANQLYLETF